MKTGISSDAGCNNHHHLGMKVYSLNLVPQYKIVRYRIAAELYCWTDNDSWSLVLKNQYDDGSREHWCFGGSFLTVRFKVLRMREDFEEMGGWWIMLSVATPSTCVFLSRFSLLRSVHSVMLSSMLVSLFPFMRSFFGRCALWGRAMYSWRVLRWKTVVTCSCVVYWSIFSQNSTFQSGTLVDVSCNPTVISL